MRSVAEKIRIDQLKMGKRYHKALIRVPQECVNLININIEIFEVTHTAIKGVCKCLSNLQQVMAQ